MQAIPSRLATSERLGRHVFSRSRAKRLSRGKPDHRAFLEAHGVDELSVDRLDYAALEVMREIAIESGKGREGEFQGWAVIRVKDAARNGRTVEARPLLNNVYHAEIVLNISGHSEKRDIQKQHAIDLATWLGRP